MRKIFVDSDYVIDYLRGLDYAKSLVEKVIAREVEGYISVVTVFELYVGGLLSTNPNKRFEDVASLLNWFQAVDIDREVMLTAANIHVELRKKGLAIGIQDVLIAATAISLGIELATNNKKHFQIIHGLRLMQR